MSQKAFVNASGNNILDITGTLRMRNSGATIPANAAVPVKFFDNNNINSVDIKAPPVLDASNTVYKLPTNYPATAGLSLLSDVVGNMSWGNPIGSLACLDVSNVDISGLIINPYTTSSQVSQAIGTCVEYTAARDISNGSICVTDISNGKVMATNPTSFLTGNSYERLIGVAIEDASAGSIIKILEEGYCSVRCDTIPGPPSSVFDPSSQIALNNLTNGTVQTATPQGIYFTDSGGFGANYLSNESFSITFDAGVGGVCQIVIDSSCNWDFELGVNSGNNPPGGYTSMFDRLGFQTSSDDITYTNGDISGMEQSSNPNPPWSTTRALGPLPPFPESGYIFPQEYQSSVPFVPYTPGSGVDPLPPTTNPCPNEAAIQMDLSVITPGGGGQKVYDTDRYLRFYFASDGSVTNSGWIIGVRSNGPFGSGANSLPSNNALLYLSSANLENSTINLTSAIPIGYVLGSEYDDLTLAPASQKLYVFARIHDR